MYWLTCSTAEVVTRTRASSTFQMFSSHLLSQLALCSGNSPLEGDHHNHPVDTRNSRFHLSRFTTQEEKSHLHICRLETSGEGLECPKLGHLLTITIAEEAETALVQISYWNKEFWRSERRRSFPKKKRWGATPWIKNGCWAEKRPQIYLR